MFARRLFEVVVKAVEVVRGSRLLLGEVKLTCCGSGACLSVLGLFVVGA